MASLSDVIFPTGDPRDGHILRLELVGSWESQFLGLGRLTAFLTPRLLADAVAVDDMGLNVVFLQRHRVEVGLKLILERAGALVVKNHKVDDLWNRGRSACAAIGYSPQWQRLATAQKPYADLLNAVDPGAATFRYPVDSKNQPWKRGQVDLTELESAGSAFQGDVMTLVRELAMNEPLPIAAPDAIEAAEELRGLVRACHANLRVSREIVKEFRRQGEALRALTPVQLRARREMGRDSDAALAAVGEVTDSLATRAQDLLDRVIATYSVQLPPEAPPRSVGQAPMLNPFNRPAAIKAQQDAQIKWVVERFLAEMQPLKESVNAVYRRSRSWSTPATRQLHLEVTRFRSRLITAEAQRKVAAS